MKGSIKSKLTFIILAVTTITSAIGYIGFISWYMNEQYKKTIELSNTIGIVISQDVGKLILLDDVSAAADISTQLKSFTNLQKLVLYKKDGKPILQYNIDNKSFDVPKIDFNNIDEISKNENLITIYHKANYQDTYLGVVFFEFKVESLSDIIKKDIFVIILIFMYVLGISFILAKTFATKFTEPVLKLVSFLERIDKTESLSKRVITSEKNEFGKLYKEVNTMLERIENSYYILKVASAAFETQSGMIITDANQKILQVNKSFSKITGYRQNEVIGKKTSILNSGIHDKNFFENMWESLKNHSTWRGEIWNKRKTGEIYSEWLSIAKALNPKYNEEFYIAIFTDISSLKEADKKIHFYANHDVLTKLANRVQFESHLKSTIESCKRRESKMALFFIDLDKFKDINDTYGHTIGDEMLKIVAKRLEQSIRKEDFIARLGGDEFVLIIKDVKNSEDMITLACKLNENIKEPITLDDKVFFMTLSIGISIFPDHGKDSEDLIKNSDAAMYVVKENGRNGYRLYSQDMTDKISLKVTIQNELKIAISKDEFEMYYQSVVDIKTNQIIGAEALVRWNHKNRGTLTPIHFINYIDEGGMSVEFGELVFKKVLHDIQIINSKLQNQDFKIAINIAPEYFFKYTFVDDVISYCKDFSINSKQIELELLETNIMKNSEISQKKIEKLHENGFDISIDDFGTGYSSLSYLKNFKVNKLKIDQSFIRDFLEDNSDKAIVQAIINLANIFNLKVQAEGVETKEHEQLLQYLNCNLAQGYFYNKPMSLNKFIDLVIKDKNE